MECYLVHVMKDVLEDYKAKPLNWRLYIIIIVNLSTTTGMHCLHSLVFCHQFITFYHPPITTGSNYGIIVAQILICPCVYLINLHILWVNLSCDLTYITLKTDSWWDARDQCINVDFSVLFRYVGVMRVGKVGDAYW